ncbi:MAG: HPt (histidine-containing phosphotransfer) domain-containing protein [Myxococcota bacterium]|jgi:HPt (histidine-containing phosphotransfer) domain-containing protein
MSGEQLPAIDASAYGALEDVADGDVEFMVELLNQYLLDAEPLVAALGHANAMGDGESLKRAAHTLKSSSANVGAITLSNFSETLQSIGRSGELVGAAVTILAAEAEYARVCGELQNRLRRLESQG